MHSNKTLFRTFHIEMPLELIPIHQELQRIYNLILQNKDFRSILLNTINYEQARGNVWRQMHSYFQDFVNAQLETESETGKIEYKIPSKAWFSRMVYEKLRQLVLTSYDNQKIFNLLESNNFKINQELREQLTSNGLYPSNNQLRNLRRAGRAPGLPYSGQFVMDYSIYNENMFIMDKTDNTKIQFRYSKKEWSDLEFNLPISLRPTLTGQIAKPKFYYKNKYIGDINYKIKPLQFEETGNILGVDYGIINTYSATVLYPNGSTSQQLLPSKRLLSLKTKLDKLQDEKKALTSKIDRVTPYLNNDSYLESTSVKQSRRLEHELDLKQKIINLKSEIAWLSAVELIELAIQYKCNTIHIDYLKWLESLGGKWNHSDCQSRLFEIAELYGIKVERVNTTNSSTTHTITDERGKPSGRLVKFSNGEKIDRDHVADINHTKCCKNGKKEARVKKINKRSAKRTKRVSNKSLKRDLVDKVLKDKRGVEIVVFSPVTPEVVVTLEHCSIKAKHSLASGHILKVRALPRAYLGNVTICHCV